MNEIEGRRIIMKINKSKVCFLKRSTELKTFIKTGKRKKDRKKNLEDLNY